MISKDQVDMYKEQLDNKSEDSVDFDTLESGINIGVSLLEQYFLEKQPEMSEHLLEKHDEVEEFIQNLLNDIVNKALEENLPDEV